MPKHTKPRRTWKYSEEFKVSAVEMPYPDGIKSNDVAQKLDIHLCMLSRWHKVYQEGRIVINKRKKITNSKKVVTGSCGRASERYRFVKKLSHDVSVNFLCRFLGISRSGYYDCVFSTSFRRKLSISVSV